MAPPSAGAAAMALEPATVLIIGMRGAGKTTLGSAAAELLGWEFFDLDKVITQKCSGKQPPQIVEERGWDAFRQLELEALAGVLGSVGGAEPAAAGPEAATPRIVSLGGGIVETQQGQALLERHWPVIMIDAPWEDVMRRLEQQAQEAHRADLGEDLCEAYARRLPRYRRCANVRFPVARGDPELSVLGRSLARLCLRLLGRSDGVHLGPETFALLLTLPDCTRADPRWLGEISLGADVLELRVDLLASLEPDFVSQQVAVLRQYTFGAPLLFTVRSADHGGRFAGPEQEYLDLLKLGLAVGVDMLDVECTWTQACLDEIVANRGTTLLVGSHYDILQLMPDREDIHASFKSCMLGGAAAVARVVVRGGNSREQNLLVQHMGNAAVPAGTAFVGLCAGREGRLSCLLNRVLCPATHPHLGVADPGLLPIQELVHCRRTLSILTPGRLYPVLGPWHGTPARQIVAALRGAFISNGLGHASREERVAGLEEVRRLLSLASVGGALVQGELQREVVPLMQELSDAAALVGAVDCIVHREDGSLFGESAQTIAICERLRAVGLHVKAKGRVGLVLGSGVAGRAALVALKAVGFGRVLRANSNNVMQELKEVPAFTVLLDRSASDPLGIDISHNHGSSVRVESIKDGLVQAWNAAHPDLEVRSGDWIVSVNGVMGDCSKILAECGKTSLLQVRVIRDHVFSLAEEPLQEACTIACPISNLMGSEKVTQDLTILAPLESLDCLILGELPEDGCRQITGAQWLASTVGRLRPLVVETAWPPRRVPTPGSGPDLLEAAKSAGCDIAEGAEMLFEQVCTCLLKWTGDASLRQRIAKVLLEEVSKVQAAPMALVDAASS